MGRPIGKRVVQACEIVEQLGPVGSRAVWLRMYDVGQENASKYLERAASYGLLTVEKIGKRRVFTIIPGWRETAGAMHKPGVKPKKEVIYRPHRGELESIWQSSAQSTAG